MVLTFELNVITMTACIIFFSEMRNWQLEWF